MTTDPQSASRLANESVRAIEAAFDRYLAEFRLITRRAEDTFITRDWVTGAADAAERLDLYPARIRDVVAAVMDLLGDRAHDKLVWAATKAVYSGHIAHRSDCELAETFFNSLTRQVFTTVGVDHDVEFVATDFALPPEAALQPVHVIHRGTDPADLIESILADHGPDVPFRDLDGDVAAVIERLGPQFAENPPRAEVLDAVFYRRRRAYVVGRLRIEDGWVPLVLALVNHPEGMSVDAVLTEPDDVSVLFSFTRSHFHLDLAPSRAVVSFLSSLMPRKRIAELYIAIGHHKHGKTELYRDLVERLDTSQDKLDFAPGTPGLVMVTFALPAYDLVFKVIRDRFPAQKRVTIRGVRDNYRLVFRHDRAGRLVEAHEFEHLRLERHRFTTPLLVELLDEASRSVRLVGDHVEIDRVYIERRVTPLDVFLKQASDAAARTAVIDYGKAIEDLAATGIFPGDLLLKNFGITRHGRVVSYDYDELSLLADIRFRSFPTPRTPDEEFAAEPWFAVGAGDVFPEEFRTFLGLSGDLRAAFTAECGHLFEVPFWHGVQDRVAHGEIIDIMPYRQDLRLHHQPAAMSDPALAS